MIQEILEYSTFKIAIASFALLLVFLIKFWKDIKSGARHIVSFFSKSSSFEISKLKEEIQNQKTAIDSYRARLVEAEKFLDEIAPIVENHVGIASHPAKVFVESQKNTYRFTSHFRVTESHRLSEFLNLLEARLRLIPFADQQLTLDLSQVTKFNQKSISSISEIFDRIAEKNGIRLRLIFDQANKNHLSIRKSLERRLDSLAADSVEIYYAEQVGADKTKRKHRRSR